MTGKGTPALTESVTRESAGLLRRLLGSSPTAWLRARLRRLLGLGRAAVIAIPSPGCWPSS